MPVFFALTLIRTRKHALMLGAFFGIATTCLAYFWLSRFQDYSAWALGSVCIGYAVEYSLVFLALRFIIDNTPYEKQGLPLAIAWTAYEYLKSIGFLGFPWTLLAQSVHGALPIIQLARITGVWGVSFILAICNGLVYSSLYHAINKRKKEHYIQGKKIIKQWAAFGLSLAAVLTYGMYSISSSKNRPIKKHIPMLLVQQNIDSWEFQDTDGIVKNLENIIEQTQNSIETADKKPELIVWSETSLKKPYQPGVSESWDELYATRPSSLPFREFLKRYNTPLLSGSAQFDEVDDSLAYNSAILIHPDGSLLDKYAKYQLVPFAELIPFYEYKPVRTFMNNVINVYGTWSRVKSFAPLAWSNYDGQGNTLYIGTPICFEDSFPYITRAMTNNGADVLINITNVSWSSSKSAQVQQLAAAKFRSIETGLPLVRSTNSGVTSIVDPWGRMGKSLPMFTEATLQVDVPMYEKRKTPYLVIGDSFAYLMVAAAAYIILSIRRRKRKASKS